MIYDLEGEIFSRGDAENAEEEMPGLVSSQPVYVNWLSASSAPLREIFSFTLVTKK